MDKYTIRPDGSAGFKIQIKHEDGTSASGPNFTTEADARAWIAQQAQDAPHTISTKGNG